MKKNRLYFGMLILMLVAVIIWAFYNMLNVGKQETSYRVSVVVENSNSDRWTSLRQGLEQAARDYNISLSFVSTGSFSPAMEEMDVVKKQVTNGANGIILQMNTDHAGQELEDLSGQTAVLLLETDVDPEGVYALVAPDNEEMGAALAQAVQSDFGPCRQARGNSCVQPEPALHAAALYGGIAGIARERCSRRVEPGRKGGEHQGRVLYVRAGQTGGHSDCTRQ